MKLYLAPGACSLAAHIALHEAGKDFERINVDLRNKRTADGADFNTVNPKGYVPTLVLDDGATITENVAILDWIAHQSQDLAPQGKLAHTRMLEMLAFISTEVHKQFGRTFFPTSDAEKDAAVKKIGERFELIASNLKNGYLLGETMSVADAYLYVMLRWAGNKGVTLPAALAEYKARLEQRPAVKQALEHEGLDKK